MKTKNGLFRFVVLFVGISLAFTFMGCDLDGGGGNGGGGNGGGGATAVPDNLKGTTWYKEGSGNIADFFFTDDRLNIGDPDSFHVICVVKVTGAKIEYTTETLFNMNAPMWLTFCTSYVRSGELLTLIGSVDDEMNGVYKNSPYTP